MVSGDSGSEHYSLEDHEEDWVALQPHLLFKGYRLRPRFTPGWVPSWTTGKQKEPWRCEDALTVPSAMIDAVRVSDGAKVVMKKVETRTEEIPIGVYLSSTPMCEDPRNHCVPILDVILLPGNDDQALIVMPMLYEFEALPFRRAGECVEMMHQFLQALEFLHEHNIAHRDACRLNLMMDVSKMVPKGFHFAQPDTHNGVYDRVFSWRERWAVRPVKYFLIDFGLSTHYKSSGVLDSGILGQDRTVPELSLYTPYDPFKVDLYQLGNAMTRIFNCYEKNSSLELLKDVGRKLTQRDPKHRPSALQAVQEMDRLISGMKRADLETRIWNSEFPLRPFARFLVKYFRYNPLL